MNRASGKFALPYIYLTAGVEFELQSLNGAGTVGNMLKLQEAVVVVDGQQLYVPVITGNALKNWHARAMAVKYLELGGTKIHRQHFEEGMYRITTRIAEEAKQKIPQSAGQPSGASGSGARGRGRRSREEPEGGEEEGRSFDIIRDYERVLIDDCAICDVHGFLLAVENYPQVRRESCVKFSFAVPNIDGIEQAKKFSITHNRVSSIPEEMMVFKREYASARYAWCSLANLAGIGTSQYTKHANTRAWVGARLVDVNEIVNRVKSAVLAYSALFTGELGASASRALPLFRPIEAVSVVTERPIPPPLHPFYKDYLRVIESSLTRYGENVVKGAFAFGVEIKGAESCSNVYELLEKTADKAREVAEELWRNLEGGAR